MTRRIAAIVALVVVSPLIVVMACGPYFTPEVFVPSTQPANVAKYASGQLGVPQSSYWIAEKVVAYRYLNGGKLSADEQKAYLQVTKDSVDWSHISDEEIRQRVYRPKDDENKHPIKQWIAARTAYGAGTPESTGQDRSISRTVGGSKQEIGILNCNDAAFSTAVTTLTDRTKRWGAASADLKDWVAAQDAVFSNCTREGVMPQDASAGVSALLKKDRAYQIAAAQFYAMKYDEAAAGFDAIAKDTASPWSKWGEYLAARAIVRKAALMGSTAANWGEQAQFDKETLQQAEKRLVLELQDTKDAEVKAAAQAELGFVFVRSKPEDWLQHMATTLAGPKEDPNFKQDLMDLRFLYRREVKVGADLVSWMDAQSIEGNDPQGNHAKPVDSMAEWKRKKTLPWLVLAMQQSKVPNTEAMDAVAKVPAGSPAFMTVNYHRARLLQVSGKQEQARTLATQMLAFAQKENDAASENLLRSVRMKTASSLQEMLIDAPRTTIGGASERASNALCGAPPQKRTTACVAKLPDKQFDTDAAQLFNASLPLSRWIDAAKDTGLPPHLREAVAEVAWLRAVLLEDNAAAKEAVVMMPAKLRDEIGDGGAWNVTMTLLYSPGLVPYLQQGVQRSVSYDNPGYFRDAWWCMTPSRGEQEDDGPKTTVAPEISFLTAQDRAIAAKQRAALDAMPGGVVWLGRRTVAYAKAHPEERRAAEALARVVYATHYGCYKTDEEQQRKVVSKDAFELLHRQYPKSEWAMKTKYYY